MSHQTELGYTDGEMELRRKVKALPLLLLVIVIAGLLLVLAACGSLQSTPAPSPTPVLLTAAEILALSREQIEQVKTLRVGVSGKFQQGDVTYPFKMDGEMELPDRVHGTVEILGEQQEFLSIGEEDFTAEPGRSFERNDDDEFGSFFLGLLNPVLEPGSDDPFIDPTRQRDETLEGQVK